MANTIEIKLGLKGASEVTAGLQKVQASAASAFGALKTLALPLAGAAGLAGITAGLKDIVDLGGKLKDMSAATGVGAAKLMVYSTALRDAGVNADNMGAIFAHMGKALEDAFDGNGPGAKGLSRVGLDINDLINKDPATQFDSIAAAIGKLATPSERAAAAMAIFGKSGNELVPFFRDGGALTDAAKTLGALPEVMARNKATLDAIGDSFGHLKIKGQQLFAGFLDMTAPILKGVTDIIDTVDFTPLGQKMGAAVKLALDAWRSGKLAELIGDYIEAGFMLGRDKMLQLSVSGALWKPIANGLFTALNESLKLIAQGFVSLMEFSANRVIDLAELTGQKIAALMNKIPGVKVHADKGTYDQWRSETAAMSNDFRAGIGTAFDNSTAAGRGILGVNSQVSGAQKLAEINARLNALIAEQNKLKGDGDDKERNMNIRVSDRLSLLKQERWLDSEIAATKTALRDVESSFAMTEVEKYNEKRSLLETEIALQKDKLRILQAQADAETDVNAKQQMLGRIDSLNNAIAGTQGQLSGMGADPESFSQQWQKAFKEVKNEWGTVAQNIANVGKTAMQSLTRTMGNALDDMIWRTGSLKDLWKSFAHTLTSSVTQALSNMFAQWITGIITKNTVERTQETLTTAPKATNALLDSVSSFGIAAAVGAAALLAAMAAFGGFREHGGPVTAGTAYVVGERRPELFIPSTSGVIVPRVDTGTAAAAGGPAASAAEAPITVICVANYEQAHEIVMRTPKGRKVVVDALRGSRMEMGVST